MGPQSASSDDAASCWLKCAHETVPGERLDCLLQCLPCGGWAKAHGDPAQLARQSFRGGRSAHPQGCSHALAPSLSTTRTGPTARGLWELAQSSVDPMWRGVSSGALVRQPLAHGGTARRALHTPTGPANLCCLCARSQGRPD